MTAAFHLCRALAALLAHALAGTAGARDCPNRPIEAIAPYPPAGIEPE